MRIHLLVWLLLCPFVNGMAQSKAPRELEIWGSVVDALTNAPVYDVRAELLHLPDSAIVDTMTTTQGDSNDKPVSFLLLKISQPGRYIVRCKKEGYETTDNPLHIPRLYKHEVFRSMLDKPFLIRKSTRAMDRVLDEVVVTASKVKFYLDGDTIIYNADAFNLAEGSMLDALIRQLPGTELKENGEITVNGRHVDELLLNGKNFFNNDRQLMLDNLPAYMVKNVKAYEREELLSKMRGDNTKIFTMNVQLKRQYSIGWIANAELGMGTKERFVTRLFALRFTPNSRLSLFANINNTNEARKPGQQGDWSPEKQPTGVLTTFDGGLDYNVEQKNMNWKTEGSLRVTHQREDNRSNTLQENFLDGGNTFVRSLSQSLHRNTSISTSHQLSHFKSLELLPVLGISYLGIKPFLNRSASKSNGYSAAATFSQDVSAMLGHAWTDSIMSPMAGETIRSYAINRLLTNAVGNGHKMSTGTEWTAYFCVPHDDRLRLHLSGSLQYTDNDMKSFDHYKLNYKSSADFRNRHNRDAARGLSNLLTISTANIWMFQNLIRMVPNYNYRYRWQETNRSLYLLNRIDAWGENTSHALGELPSAQEMLIAFDANNSSRARQTSHDHSLSAQLSFNSTTNGRRGKNNGERFQHWKCYLQIDFKPTVRFERNGLRYQKSDVDTLLSHRHAFFEPSLAIFCSPLGHWDKWNAELRYSSTASAPNLTDLVNQTDDSDPLNVMAGNAQLQSSRRHAFSAAFRQTLSRQRMWNIGTSVNLLQRAIAFGYYYNKENGVRKIKPENVNGNWEAHLNVGFSSPLDKARFLNLSTTTSLSYYNSVDLISVSTLSSSAPISEQSPQRSTVGSFYVNETLKMDYRPTSNFNLSIKGDIHFLRSVSQRPDFATINACDFDYGLIAQAELPWAMQISTDITMYSRRGYSDTTMNTNELVWNARLSKRFLQGNLVLKLDAFDLLGKLSNVRRTINSQGRIERWNNVIPRYALLSLVYRFNKQPKK